VGSPPPEEEGAVETMCDALTVTPIPCPPASHRGGGRETRVKLSPGRRRGGGKVFEDLDLFLTILL